MFGHMRSIMWVPFGVPCEETHGDSRGAFELAIKANFTSTLFSNFMAMDDKQAYALKMGKLIAFGKAGLLPAKRGLVAGGQFLDARMCRQAFTDLQTTGTNTQSHGQPSKLFTRLTSQSETHHDVCWKSPTNQSKVEPSTAQFSR